MYFPVKLDIQCGKKYRIWLYSSGIDWIGKSDCYIQYQNGVWLNVSYLNISNHFSLIRIFLWLRILFWLKIPVLKIKIKFQKSALMLIRSALNNKIGPISLFRFDFNGDLSNFVHLLSAVSPKISMGNTIYANCWHTVLCSMHRSLGLARISWEKITLKFVNCDSLGFELVLYLFI